MKTNEHDYYDSIANWSFDDINYSSDVFTNWIYEDEISKRINKDSRVLDLGTGGGERLLKDFPECQEILATDFSEEMINTAKKNLLKSGRKNVIFRVMDNLSMDTSDNYFDLVTARHSIIDPVQIYKTLKDGGYLIVRGVDKLDCWMLKKMFGRGQAYWDTKPISLIDYEAIMDAGFKDVELIPIHVVEYFKTSADLYALLVKAPILDDFSEETCREYERVPIEREIFDQYVSQNQTDNGIKLVRRYYGIIAKK